MPEIDPIVWYYTLKTKSASVKLGMYRGTFLFVESDGNNQSSSLLAERFNNLSFDEREYFISDRRDFNYDPPRVSVEQCVRKNIEDLGWFDEFELEYLLSPPDERYIGPGTKEWKEWEKFVRDNPDIHISPW